MTTGLEQAGVSAEAFVVVGLATCFIKADGEVNQVEIVEPIPSAALEALMKGIPTSYQQAIATTVGALWDGSQVTLPEGLPEGANACHEFPERLMAAARTYLTNPEAKSLIPVGTRKADFNFSTERKRVLNASRRIGKSDNVKQHAYTHQVL